MVAIEVVEDKVNDNEDVASDGSNEDEVGEVAKVFVSSVVAIVD
jgi:hypothetical protein